MTQVERIQIRERTHLEIAATAAVKAGLAPDETSARSNIEEIIERHAQELKSQWLRERGGGIKGWLYFLRTFGFEEHLAVRRISARSDPSLNRRSVREVEGISEKARQ